MHLYGLKNCDTCRKVMKAFPGATLVDVRNDGVPDNVLAQAHEIFGDQLVNTRSTTWRSLDEEARARPALTLLKEHPALMKRPLIQQGDTLFLGWSKETQAALGAA